MLPQDDDTRRRAGARRRGSGRATSPMTCPSASARRPSSCGRRRPSCSSTRGWPSTTRPAWRPGWPPCAPPAWSRPRSTSSSTPTSTASAPTSKPTAAPPSRTPATCSPRPSSTTSGPACTPSRSASASPAPHPLLELDARGSLHGLAGDEHLLPGRAHRGGPGPQPGPRRRLDHLGWPAGGGDRPPLPAPGADRRPRRGQRRPRPDRPRRRPGASSWSAAWTTTSSCSGRCSPPPGAGRSAARPPVLAARARLSASRRADRGARAERGGRPRGTRISRGVSTASRSRATIRYRYIVPRFTIAAPSASTTATWVITPGDDQPGPHHVGTAHGEAPPERAVLAGVAEPGARGTIRRRWPDPRPCRARSTSAGPRGPPPPPRGSRRPRPPT